MTFLGGILYHRELMRHPYMKTGRMPYEKLSGFLTWKLQKQIYYHDYTLRRAGLHFVQRVVRMLKGWRFRRGYYVKDGKTYNKYNDKPYYIHNEKGMYKVSGKPCSPDCRYCKKMVTVYPSRV